MLLRFAILILCLLACGTTRAQGGKVVVFADEWVFSDAAFYLSSSTTTLVQNLTNWLAGGPGGNFLAYSTNASITGVELEPAVIAAGHQWTAPMQLPPATLALFQSYDAVFLMGNPAPASVITSYLAQGGAVVIFGGAGSSATPFLTCGTEAQLWNPPLTNYGFAFNCNPDYGSISGLVPVSSSHPILTGVLDIYIGIEQDVLDTDPNDSGMLLVQSGNVGLLGVYDSEPTFLRGDCNDDASRNIADAVRVLDALFGNSGAPPCADACDSNDDGAFNIADAIAILGALFMPGGNPIPAPANACGVDPTVDTFSCISSTNCP
ncbi:MAG: hypothetical protein AAF581_14660 [Planctomycetota bacterium]